MTDPELCHCDAFDEPHEIGRIEVPVYCERLYTAPTISPHMFGVDPNGNRPVT